MLKILLFALLLVPLAGSVMATTATSLFPYQYQETTLPNGLTVILIPMKNAGLVSYFTVIHAGSRNEVEPGKSGFAHFFEHIMFKGTDKYPGDVRNKITTEMGADTNAYTSDDMTVYYLHFPDRYLEKVVDLEADRFMNLKYSLADFQTEARAVLGEYNKNFANPFFQLEERLRDVSFDASSYKHTTMGFVKDIQDMPNQYEYSLQFFKRFYRPDNATILITGNFDPAKALELVKKYYAPWQGKAVTITQAAEPAQKGARTGKVDYPGDTLPIFVAAYKAPGFVA
ncbi:MAG TPA: pitrilysin family protein, partial [Acidobacteriota bacterium]|nr:pitrilysin family protein [Acidobacteriota bacterium]